MSETLSDEIKRWTAKRKSALVIEVIQRKTTVAEASRTYDLTPSEIEECVEDGRKGMENALRANRRRLSGSLYLAVTNYILINCGLASRLKLRLPKVRANR